MSSRISRSCVALSLPAILLAMCTAFALSLYGEENPGKLSLSGFCNLSASTYLWAMEIASTPDGTPMFVGMTIGDDRKGDLFLARLPRSGGYEKVISIPLTGPGECSPSHLAILADHAWIAGVFTREVQIGGKSLKSRGHDDIFLCGISLKDGVCDFLESFGGSAADNVHGLCVSRYGVYFCGQVSEGGRFRDLSIGSADIDCYYIAKYSPTDGTLKVLSGSARTEISGARALSQDIDGALWVAGWFCNELSFGQTTYTPPIARGVPTFIGKLTPDLLPTAVFISSPDSDSWDQPWCVVPDGKGGCFYGGNYDESTVFAGATLSNRRNGKAISTGIVGHLDAKCKPLRATDTPSTGASRVYAIQPVGESSLFVALAVEGTANMPGVVSEPTAGKVGVQQILVAVLGPDMKWSHAARIAATGYAIPLGAVLLGKGDLLLEGCFQGNLDQGDFHAKAKEPGKFSVFISLPKE
ncbi:MAG: hypothetical protein WC712_12995 [Candidatus Brocadiia bacterium]